MAEVDCEEGHRDGELQEEEEQETPEEMEERKKHETAIRSILDQQSIIQFRQYAQDQHPKEIEKQQQLIAEMQDHYFQYYMENVQQSQIINQQKQIEQLLDLRDAAQKNCADQTTATANQDDAVGEPIPLPIVPAGMWTRKDIAEFKKDILANHKECCIKISSLASASLRVPTHEDGTSIFFEFATDNYDLGFGLYFEWNLQPQDDITMTISESSDEEDEGDDDEDDYDEADPASADPEAAAARRAERAAEKAKRQADAAVGDVESGGRRPSGAPAMPTDELIPVYRRDCHTEVYCGSHQYPGCGVYIFKFDNSFSLWRSKWLYYRVFYGK